ncbi:MULTISPECIES: ribokinase [Cryobacterium]|uniref:Ribokinase n=2 Tax=Cryobacterium TaxID=69578 RepID=A0ABY2IJP4_9MICO|nr:MULTISPECIES: ribokinase [Cryobacterium]MEB0004480.1 ribokinase [Cryobacterium sp. RTC2.1]MEB0288005.1 ribokinase [Cryobacterium sp. 10S3]TFB93743.1 ribokinase [Cryobacterium sp. MDB2-A-1]TFC09045.1 ribokinase [Cryobacterium sp. MDB2-33-2]TFC14825.1 ribokinase [Cryobacterium sp. MDB2-A-2]
MNRIAVLGSANMDLVVRQPRLPRPGETIFGHDFALVPGGKGLNQAVAAARQGGAVDFLGAVGRDAYGTELRALLVAEGIRVDGLDTVDGPTGTAHITVLDSGENSIVVVSGANAAVTVLDPGQRAVIAAADFLVLQCELPVSALVEGLAVARASGTFTVFTPAPVVPLPAAFLAGVDLVVANRLEAEELTGEADAARAAESLSARRGWAIVTLGDEGCVVARGGVALGLAPARPVRPVDTTGAGDTFVGALVARLAEGSRGAVAAAGAEVAPDAAVTGAAESGTGGARVGVSEEAMIDAIRWATVAASVSVTRAGATASMPTRAEVAAILA